MRTLRFLYYWEKDGITVAEFEYEAGKSFSWDREECRAQIAGCTLDDDARNMVSAILRGWPHER